MLSRTWDRWQSTHPSLAAESSAGAPAQEPRWHYQLTQSTARHPPGRRGHSLRRAGARRPGAHHRKSEGQCGLKQGSLQRSVLVQLLGLELYVHLMLGRRVVALRGSRRLFRRCATAADSEMALDRPQAAPRSRTTRHRYSLQTQIRWRPARPGSAPRARLSPRS